MVYNSMDDIYHNIGMNNIYNYVSIFVGSLKHPTKVITHIMTSNGDHGIQKVVFQVEVKIGNDEKLYHSTVSAALLCGGRWYYLLTNTSLLTSGVL